MFSLCIPTMDRYNDFLSKYLPLYLENDLIEEIIITDENGNDIEKIKSAFSNNEKLVLVKNESRLGPFQNKLKACSFAKNEWIVLIDSDNFADKNYFIVANDYIEKNNIKDKNIILSPCKAKPNFDYSYLSGYIFKNGTIQNNVYLDKGQSVQNNSFILMNTGNYIINKYLIDNVDLSWESENIKQSSACDVIYFNTLLFEQLDLHLHVVPNLEYEHTIHDGSIYIQTYKKFHNFNEIVYERYRRLQC
jgi:hypothetical protein